MALLTLGLALLVLFNQDVCGTQIQPGGLSSFTEIGHSYFEPRLDSQRGLTIQRKVWPTVREGQISMIRGRIPGANGAASNNGGIIKWENITSRFAWRRKRQSVGNTVAEES